MKRKNFKLLLLAPLVSIFAWVSCTNEEPINNPVLTEEAVVTFSLNVPGNSTPASRAMDDATEYKVNTIEVMAFKEGKFSYWVSADAALQTGNTYKATLKLTQGTYDLVVFANSKEIISGSAPVKNTTTKADALKALTKTISGKWNANGSSSEAFPMSSDPSTLTSKTINETSTFSTIDLYRMTARVQVSLGTTAAGKFEMEEIRVYNRNKTGYVVGDRSGDGADPAVVNAYGVSRVAPVKNDDNTKLIYTKIAGEVSATACEKEIYLFEVANLSTLKSDERPCVVVGGKYDGKTYYYRVDFHDGTNYLDVLRNHSYNIVVTDVTGAGFEDPDDAFTAGPENIEAAVKVWDNTSIGDIVFDGQNYLGISPTEFNLYRGEQLVANNHRINIETDVAVVGGKNWEATLYAEDGVTELTDANRWFELSAYSGGVVSPAKSTVTLTAKENPGATRIGWIYIKAGRLVYKIKVTQSNQEEPDKFEIKIFDKDGNDVSELFFEAKGNTPAAQEFTVTWTPANSQLRATLVPAATPLNATYTPTISTTGELLTNSAGVEYSVAPQPATLSGFDEKSSLVRFELETPAGPITKTINLRQTTCNLEPQPATILMDGTLQTFYVKANFSWRAEIVSVTEDDKTENSDRIIKYGRSGWKYGNNNITTGDPISFTCFDYISEYDPAKPQRGTVTIGFWRFDADQWVEWDTYDVTCYAAVPVGESNCYMINNTDPVPILIPTSQIQYAMNGASGAGSGFVGPNWIEKPNNLKVEVLWSDINKFYTDDSVIKAVAYDGATTDINNGKIVVVPGRGTGNAGIILYEDNNSNDKYDTGDKIRWSWHIWNSDYYPYDSDGNVNTKVSPNTNGFMDRNLGASSATAGDVGTIGLVYQWGRKDPFPGASAFNSTNNTTFHKGPNITSYIFTEIGHSENINLPNAVLNPLTRYFLGTNSSKYDWFTHKGIQNDNLWGGANKTDLFLHTGNGGHKSAYDPCPEGYRVPKNGTDGWGILGVYWDVATSGRINSSYGGYYPIARFRHNSDVGFYDIDAGRYWQATTNDIHGDFTLLYSSGNIDPKGYTNRSFGFSVRCRAE